jgi:phosphohistidine phosphatase
VKTVLLLRHAKSSWDDGGLADHERPLSRRGERAAELMAEHVVKRAPRPDLILCSTAVRSRQTLAPLVHRLTAPAPPILLEKGLYMASEDTLMARLRDVPDDAATVLLIGHNDGIWQFAEVLAGRGKAALLSGLHGKFPTGALAVLKAPIKHWADLTAGSAELSGYVRPKDLVSS